MRPNRQMRLSVRSVLGAAAVGALMLGVTPAFALNDPTPIGLPPLNPATSRPRSLLHRRPTDWVHDGAPTTDQVQAAIGGAPLPPLPAPPPEGQAPIDPAAQPTDPVMQPAATGAQPAPRRQRRAGPAGRQQRRPRRQHLAGLERRAADLLDAEAGRAADPAVAARSPAPPAADQGAWPERRRRRRYAGAAARRAAARHGLQRRGDAADQGRRQCRAGRRQGRVREGAQRRRIRTPPAPRSTKWSRARRPSTSIGARLCCSARSSAARRTRRASASTSSARRRTRTRAPRTSSRCPRCCSAKPRRSRSWPARPIRCWRR